MLVEVDALFAAPGRAHADEKRCEIESESGKLVCTLSASPGPPRVVRLSDDLPLVWMRLEWNHADGLSRDIGWELRGTRRRKRGAAREACRVRFVAAILEAALQTQHRVEYTSRSDSRSC